MDIKFDQSNLIVCNILSEKQLFLETNMNVKFFDIVSF